MPVYPSSAALHHSVCSLNGKHLARSACHKELNRFFLFWPHLVACGILVPQPGIEPTSTALETWHRNHWTISDVREFLKVPQCKHLVPQVLTSCHADGQTEEKMVILCLTCVLAFSPRCFHSTWTGMWGCSEERSFQRSQSRRPCLGIFLRKRNLPSVLSLTCAWSHKINLRPVTKETGRVLVLCLAADVGAWWSNLSEFLPRFWALIPHIWLFQPPLRLFITIRSIVCQHTLIYRGSFSIFTMFICNIKWW